MADIQQRDAFWNRIYELAKADRNIVLISEDMGAPALDRIRLELPQQFVNVGIAEQNGALIAAGLSLEGKKPFVYAIAPFVTLRCLEQYRVQQSIMDLRIGIVGVGAGFGYEDSGPTHHIIEDIAVMRAFPNITIYNCSDSVMAAAAADLSCEMKSTSYIRLDRLLLPELHRPDRDFVQGFSVLREGKDGMIIATGCMVHSALDVSTELAAKGFDVGVTDVYRIPTDEKALVLKLGAAKKIFTLEEHFLPGGFGSYILEILSDAGLLIPVKRIGLPFEKGYCYEYGGRECIRNYYGLTKDHIRTVVERNL